MLSNGWQLPDDIPNWVWSKKANLTFLFGCHNGEKTEDAQMLWKPKNYTGQDLKNLFYGTTLRYLYNDLDYTRYRLVEVLIRNSWT